jgi:hypothetical protein
MAELSTSQPLFPGDSDIDQLYIVQKMLGTHWMPSVWLRCVVSVCMLVVFATCWCPGSCMSWYSSVYLHVPHNKFLLLSLRTAFRSTLPPA